MKVLVYFDRQGIPDAIIEGDSIQGIRKTVGNILYYPMMLRDKPAFLSTAYIKDYSDGYGGKLIGTYQIGVFDNVRIGMYKPALGDKYFLLYRDGAIHSEIDMNEFIRAKNKEIRTRAKRVKSYPSDMPIMDCPVCPYCGGIE